MAKCQFLPKRCFSFCFSPINDAAQGRAMDGPLTTKKEKHGHQAVQSSWKQIGSQVDSISIRFLLLFCLKLSLSPPSSSFSPSVNAIYIHLYFPAFRYCDYFTSAIIANILAPSLTLPTSFDRFIPSLMDYVSSCDIHNALSSPSTKTGLTFAWFLQRF